MSAGPACPLCGGRSAKTFVRAWREYSLYDCPDCGAGFCDPFRNPGPGYYENDKDVYAVKLEETTDPSTYEYDEALRLLASLPEGARLLDAGCGAGGFLHRARAARFKVSGLDFNAERVAALRGRGFDVFAGGLPEYARGAAPASFDAITLFEILEHLDEPAAWLDAAKGLLKPGGLLIVGTPNRERAFDPYRGALEAIDNPPHHLTRWSAAALARLLSRRGLTVVDCRDLAYPPALAAQLLRSSLSLGLAVRALDVDRLREAPAAAAAPGARERAVKALVGLKIAALTAAAYAGHPLFRAAAAAFGWQGAALFAAARKPGPK
jgi:2-polyprenyl-3-methyl-5-hydroxy-6-metoxy-1,4-benzoquinol methylase